MFYNFSPMPAIGMDCSCSWLCNFSLFFLLNKDDKINLQWNSVRGHVLKSVFVFVFVCVFICLFVDFSFSFYPNYYRISNILARFQELCGTANQRPRETVIQIVRTSATTRYMHISSPKSSYLTYSSSFFSFQRAVVVAVLDIMTQIQKLEISYPQAVTAM